MKFKIKGDNFVNALLKLNNVIPTRSTLPILENILFKLEGNSLMLLASDLEIFVRVTLEVTGEENGTAAVDAKRLIDVTKTLPSETLSIESDDKNRLTIKTRKGKFTLPGESSEDFPEPEIKDFGSTISVDGGTIRSFISKVIHAVNTDEIRRNMAGILFEVNEDQLRIVATDGFRLGKVVKSGFDHKDTTDMKMIIPNKTCNLFLRLNHNNDCEISYNESYVRFKFGDTEIFSKLIDDTFPNYDSVIPKDNDKTLKVLKKDLIDSLRRAEVIADPITKRVKFEINSSSLRINSDNPEIGAEAEESLECEFSANDGSENFDDEPFGIAFNAKYILECLQQIDSNEIRFTFNTSSKATIAYPTEQSDDTVEYMELVMPVRMG